MSGKQSKSASQGVARVVALGLFLASVGAGTGACKSMPIPGVSVRVPKKHRAGATACPHERGTPPEPSGGQRPSIPADNSCSKHADCTSGKNGRCFPQRGGARCSYDNCYADADCGTGKEAGACVCRDSGTATGANYCLRGNCRTDADCGGNYCSPSLGSCGHMGGNVGFFCHSKKDECVDDEDCKPFHDGACRYVPEAGAFKCSTSECVG